MTEAAGGWSPLAGKRVIDFGWVVSAPLVGTLAASLGAEVIKIESRKRVDNLRLRGAIRRGHGVDWSIADNAPTFNALNRGKLSFGVDVKAPEGLELVKGLIASADAIVENYTVGTLERMQLGDDILRALNPRLVRLSLTPAGRRGRLAGMRSYAATTGALAGLEGSVGYPDEPDRPQGMLTFGVADYTAGAMAAFALISALGPMKGPDPEFRSVDASQLAANVVSLGAGFAAAAAGLPTRPGNRHVAGHVPHGVFATANGGFVAIAVVDDEEWARIAPLVALQEPDLAARHQRAARRDEVEAAVAAWCGTRNRAEAVASLHEAGVRAAPVLAMAERERHPFYRRRGSTVSLTMANGREVRAPREPWLVHGSGGAVAAGRGRAPRLGEDTERLCRTILELSPERIRDLSSRDVIHLPPEDAT